MIRHKTDGKLLSSKKLNFFGPLALLKPWDVTSLFMQQEK